MPALIRWNPDTRMALHPYFRPARLLDEIEEMARKAFEGNLKPAIDLAEEEKEIIVKAELPGVKKTDLDIQLDGDVLTITAEKKDETEESEEGTTRYYRERIFGKYVRAMTLPAKVDPEGVKATLKKGLLTVRLPKAAEPEKKKIQITTK